MPSAIAGSAATAVTRAAGSIVTAARRVRPATSTVDRIRDMDSETEGPTKDGRTAGNSEPRPAGAADPFAPTDPSAPDDPMPRLLPVDAERVSGAARPRRAHPAHGPQRPNRRHPWRPVDPP